MKVERDRSYGVGGGESKDTECSALSYEIGEECIKRRDTQRQETLLIGGEKW